MFVSGTGEDWWTGGLDGDVSVVVDLGAGGVKDCSALAVAELADGEERAGGEVWESVRCGG